VFYVKTCHFQKVDRTMPTYLTLLRILLTFAVIFTIVFHAPILLTISLYSIAASTDLLDGMIARKYGLVSTFGARADMIADRFLWVGTTIAFLLIFGVEGSLKLIDSLQLCAIMTREIVAAPFALIALFRGNAFPPARYVAKVTTFLQGFALPALILSLFFPKWVYISLPISIVIFFTGLCSACSYIKDVRVMPEKK
jgi:phosphatidylglycerophosphate synthase